MNDRLLKTKFAASLTIPVFYLAVVVLQLDASANEEKIFARSIQPFLEKNCYRCHGEKKQKGDLRLSDLTAVIKTPEEAQIWQDAWDALDAGDMPPEDETQPGAAEVSTVLSWIGDRVSSVEEQFAGRSVMRRLGRYEYENTLRDLFQLPRLTVADLIPADAKRHAFDNNGLVLDIGSAHLDGYMNAIDVAIAKAGSWDRRGVVDKNPYSKDTVVYGLIPQGIDEQAYNENLARHERLDLIAPLPHARRTKYHSSYVFRPKTEGTYRIHLKHYLHRLDERRGDVVVNDKSPTAEVKSRVVDVFRVKPGTSENAQDYELEIYLTPPQTVTFTVSSPPRTVGLPGWYQRFPNPKDGKAFFEKGRPDDEYQQALKIYDMIYLALLSDSTRVIGSIIPNYNVVPQGIKGVDGDHHVLTHHGQVKEKIRQLSLIEDEEMKVIAAFLKRLKGTPEGDGNLLDHTMVCIGSESNDLSRHASEEVPIILAGGPFKHGQFLSKEAYTQNLYLTMLHKLGIEDDSWGNSTGDLSDLG